MKGNKHMKTITKIIYSALAAFACFALVPTTRAVSPPPDGAYPNVTTAEGLNALQSLTSGAANTALGAYTLFSTTTASFNTAVGAGALDLNTGDSNTAVGVAALLFNTGTENTAVGVDALGSNTAGKSNAAVGAFALYNNTAGTRNTAVGAGAMETGAAGNDNTSVGELAGNGLTGTSNTVLGSGAGTGITSGGNNVCIGDGTGSNPATASGDIYMGHGVNPPGPGLEFNTVRIGDNLPTAAGASQCFIGGIAGQTVNPGGAAAVVIDNDGKLGLFLSSQRFKRDVEPMNKTSEAILGLKPVTFHYKSDPKNTPCFGLIAEEVAKVDPALVVRDKEGKPYTVRYDQVNAMLLNEFLKEHRKVEQQRRDFEAALAQQQKQIEALTAGLQKVSAQLELSKTAPQTVLNNQQ